MTFEEWYQVEFKKNHIVPSLKDAWEAAMENNCSQREAYQRGFKAGGDKMIDEAVKAAKNYDHPEDLIDANDFADGIADKIKELKG